MNTATTAAPRINAAPEILVQMNNSGAWKTLAKVGLNDMARCRDAIDTLCLADHTPGRKANFRLAIAQPSGLAEPLEYRDPVRGWYQA
jgi:hypothetical protein